MRGKRNDRDAIERMRGRGDEEGDTRRLFMGNSLHRRHGNREPFQTRDASSKIDFQQLLKLTMEFNMLLQNGIMSCNVASWQTTV